VIEYEHGIIPTTTCSRCRRTVEKQLVADEILAYFVRRGESEVVVAGQIARSPASIREERQRADVAGADGGEVAPVERRELRLAEALHDRKNCRIDETEAKIGVGRHQV